MSKKAKKKPPSADEIELVVRGPLPILIPDGLYSATVIDMQKVVRFGGPMLDLCFRLATDPYVGKVLPAFAVLPRNGATSPNAKICRWWLLIAEFEQLARPERIAIRSFKNFLFQVQVEAVKRDLQHRPLPPAQHRSVVREIVAVIGKVKKP